MTDLLIEATEALEVAVDAYAANEFKVNETFKRSGASVVSGPQRGQIENARWALRNDVVEAATAVALAMDDADVSGSSFAEIIPAGLREDAADAEVAALHGKAHLTEKARCGRCAGTGQFITYVENGVPKGPGGECYRCQGKGFTTTADRHRNYGYDNFAPISGF